MPLRLTGRVNVASAVLLTVKKTSVEFPVRLMMSLFLLTVIYYDKLACTGVGHCWCVSPHAILWTNSRRKQRSKCSLRQSNRNLLPFRPPSPLDRHLASKETCLLSNSSPFWWNVQKATYGRIKGDYDYLELRCQLYAYITSGIGLRRFSSSDFCWREYTVLQMHFGSLRSLFWQNLVIFVELNVSNCQYLYIW